MAKYRLFWSYHLTLLLISFLLLFNAFYVMSLGNVGFVYSFYEFSAVFWEILLCVFSIIALINFTKHEFNKITWILPYYHIVITILLLGFGIIWNIILKKEQVLPGLFTFGIVNPLLTIGLVAYILYNALKHKI